MNVVNTTVEHLIPGLPRDELVERLHFHQRRGDHAAGGSLGAFSSAL